MFVEYDERVDLNLLYSRFLSSKSCRYPLFTIAVIEKMGKKQFFQQMTDIAIFGLRGSESPIFKNEQENAKFVFENRHLLTIEFVNMMDENLILWHKYKNVSPKDDADAFEFWKTLSTIIMYIAFDYDDYIYDNCYRRKGSKHRYDYSQYFK